MPSLRAAPACCAVIVAALVLLLALSQRAAAATLTVTRTDDPPPDGCAPSDCSLREAIIAANAAGGADTIELVGGTYQLSIPGTGEDSSATGDLDVTSEITIDGQGTLTAAGASTPAKIDGGDLDTVFHVITGGSLTLRDLTVQNGSGDFAGGIYAEGPLTLSGVVVQNNVGLNPAIQKGGADWAVGGVRTEGALNVDTTFVVDNTASGIFAVGGIYSEIAAPEPVRSRADRYHGQGTNGSIVAISDSTISGNSATDAHGGAGGVEIYVRDYDLVVEIANAVISDNHASGGDDNVGGLYLADAGDVILTDSKILNNSATDDYGTGGIYAYAYLYMDRTTVDGNQGGNDGAGGIYEEYYTEVTNSTISNNSAGEYGGGGAYVDSELHLINSTVSGNSAGSEGAGGIYNYFGESYLRHSTIAGNMGGFGGVYNDWYLYTNNSVFADSSPRNCLMDSEVYDEGNNIDSGTSCGFYEASSEENEDPLLGPLANNGGPTMTHALMKGSPAIDAAAAGCPEPVDYYGDPYVIPGGWPRDQRGAMRPVGDGCDIGAFEAGGAPPTPTPAPTPPGTQRTFGDINCNGPADSVDSLVIQRDLASLPISQTQPCPGIGEIVDIQDASKHPWGDVDCDGDVDTVDSLKLLRFVAALSVQQEEGCPEIGATVLVQK